MSLPKDLKLFHNQEHLYLNLLAELSEFEVLPLDQDRSRAFFQSNEENLAYEFLAIHFVQAQSYYAQSLISSLVIPQYTNFLVPDP